VGVDVGGGSLVLRVRVYECVCVWGGHMWLWVSSYVHVCVKGVSEYVVVGLQFCLCKCLWQVCVLHVGGRMSVYMGLRVRGWPVCGCAHRFVCQYILSSCLCIYVTLIYADSHKLAHSGHTRIKHTHTETRAHIHTLWFCGYCWLTMGVGFHGQNLNKSSG